MDNLIGAVDETMNGKYLAFVICENKAISKNKNTFLNKFIHMTDVKISKKNKKQIITSLDLSGNLSTCCIKFDLPRIKEYIRLYVPNVSTERVNRKIAYRLKSALNNIFTPFLILNKTTIYDIPFQVDNKEIRGLLIQSGLKWDDPSHLHKIADCIVYANLKKWKLDKPHLIEKHENFSDEFFDIIIKDINR